MLLTRLAMWTFSILLTIIAGMVFSQTYPNKPIRIVAGGIGGGTDFAARLIAQGLAGPLGQQVIVENRPSGVIAEIVAKAPPDGYTLLLSGSNLWLAPFMRDSMPYDPIKDFSTISLTNRQPNVLVVHPSVPVKSVKELLALAKHRPGELNYASGGSGSGTHLAGELFKSLAGVNIVRIPYKNSTTEITDLIAGQVQISFAPPGEVMPHVKLGKLRALAVGSTEPSALARGLPTVAATVPGYEAVAINGMFAPMGTPTALINRLNQEIVRILSQADVKEKFFNSGAEAVGTSPEQLSATIKSEMARLGKVIKDAGIKAD